jgi:DNA-binding IclR family transcriptional regulator
VKDRGDPSTGLSIADIASNCQMPRDAVARLMEQLSNDGKVSYCDGVARYFSIVC